MPSSQSTALPSEDHVGLAGGYCEAGTWHDLPSLMRGYESFMRLGASAEAPGWS